MMEREILELLRLERIREPLSPGKRLREFQMRLQKFKNGEEVEVAGFLIGRRPPGAPPETPSTTSSLPPFRRRSFPRLESGNSAPTLS